ncbi:MAG: hypothetical protein JWO86_4157 [Myxococcaceae bacterium]|jgi:hypothetical protein|nr:hypothetical protein [Myxococcaceae bacterium]MEA2750300.1 hypothetical protein [Myxococcales bacterium]
MFFSDLHVQTLSRGILNPGEQLLGQTVTGYMPWWAFGFIRRQYLVLATDQRLILVDHRYSFIQPTTQRLHAIDSIPWSNVQEAKVTGLFLKKKLKVRGIGERGPVSLKMVISNMFFGLLAPMKNNMQGARTIGSVATQMQSGGAPALGPASQQQYGAPPSFQPPAQLQQPSYPPQGAYAPPMPQVNAPGYASVPPAAPQYGQVPQPYGAAPSPFDPPRQY